MSMETAEQDVRPMILHNILQRERQYVSLPIRGTGDAMLRYARANG